MYLHDTKSEVNASFISDSTGPVYMLHSYKRRYLQTTYRAIYALPNVLSVKILTPDFSLYYVIFSFAVSARTHMVLVHLNISRFWI